MSDSQTITYAQPQDSPDFIRCRDYLLLREAGTETKMEDIAAHFGVTRVTLYNWINKWTESGLLAACRTILITPKIETIEAAEFELLDDWPNILMNLRKIAKSDSFRNAIEAARLLEPTVTKLKERKPASESAEQSYIDGLARSINVFDPLAIPLADEPQE